MKINDVKRKIAENFEGKECLEVIYEFENLPNKIRNEADCIYTNLLETKEINNIFYQHFFEKMNRTEYLLIFEGVMMLLKKILFIL